MQMCHTRKAPQRHLLIRQCSLRFETGRPNHFYSRFCPNISTRFCHNALPHKSPIISRPMIGTTPQNTAFFHTAMLFALLKFTACHLNCCHRYSAGGCVGSCVGGCVGGCSGGLVSIVHPNRTMLSCGRTSILSTFLLNKLQ
jgi:hypothetical protein